jgi:hypothetical protein
MSLQSMIAAMRAALVDVAASILAFATSRGPIGETVPLMGGWASSTWSSKKNHAEALRSS